MLLQWDIHNRFIRMHLDEAIALPTDFSARIARNTQLLFARRNEDYEVIDPWGGSYYVETLTDELMERHGRILKKLKILVEWQKRLKQVLPKMKIEEAAAKRQAQIDSGKETIIGVNKLSFRERRCD